MALVVGVPGVLYLITPVLQREESSWVALGRLEDFQGLTQPFAVRFRYESNSGYVRRKRPGMVFLAPEPGSPSGLVVLSPICSHMGCSVSWDSRESLFACPCHGGRYDHSGKVVSGPPPRPLARVPWEVREGDLLIQIEDGLV